MEGDDMNELYHHGVKGMKWGVRRYQNSDGSLTSKGKKKVSKQYKKYQGMGGKDLNRSYRILYANAYNKTANKMNNGGIDKFNSAQQKKYGKDFPKRSGYDSDFAKYFNKELSKNLNKSIYEFTKSNKNYQKATELVKRYDMTKWDDLAKYNSEGYEFIKASFEKNK